MKVGGWSAVLKHHTKVGSIRKQRLESCTEKFKLSLLLLFLVLTSAQCGPSLWYIEQYRACIKKPSFMLLFFFFFFFSLSLYSPRHLTYRGSGRAIPLHALQTTNMVFWWLVRLLTSFIHLSCILKAITKQRYTTMKVPFSLRFCFLMDFVLFW